MILITIIVRQQGDDLMSLYFVSSVLSFHPFSHSFPTLLLWLSLGSLLLSNLAYRNHSHLVDGEDSCLWMRQPPLIVCLSRSRRFLVTPPNYRPCLGPIPSSLRKTSAQCPALVATRLPRPIKPIHTGSYYICLTPALCFALR